MFRASPSRLDYSAPLCIVLLDDGAHVTLGVPIIRTSVDHGPAKELYGLKKANFGSMESAIKLSLFLTRRSHV